MLTPLPQQLDDALRDSPVVSCLIANWTELDLPDCWLVAGAVVQTYWNAALGLPPLHGLSDVDIIYFDSDDLSEEAESRHAARIEKHFKDLGIKFDVKNEARVHAWYESRFGYPIAAYTSAQSAMDTFPTTAGAIGIRPVGHELEAYAPFGFDDLLNLVVRPNKRQITRSIYMDKVTRWVARWPQLEIVAWEDV